MKDEDIDNLLLALPRQKASPEFTPRVLKRLDVPTPKPARAWLRARPLLASAAAFMLLGAVTVGMRHWYVLRERADAARRIEQLRNEYEALQRELDELRSLAAASQPVVELGGTEAVDILIDLRTLGAGIGQDPQFLHQPVDYRR